MALINYAQMPVMQPRSEMAGFTDALLKAGSMREQRLDKEDQQRQQKEQQDFQNTLALQESERAQQRLGLEQERVDLSKQQVGMQGEKLDILKGQDKRQAEQDVLATKLLAMDVKKEVDNQKYAQALNQPEVQQQILGIEDPVERVDALLSLKGSVGSLYPEDIIEASEQKMNYLNFESKQATSRLQREQIRANMALTEVQKMNAQLKQQALRNPTELFDSKQMNTNFNRYQKSEDKIIGSIKTMQETYDDYRVMAAALGDPDSDLDSLKSGVQSEDAKQQAEDIMASFGSGMTAAEEAAIRQEKARTIKQLMSRTQDRIKKAKEQWAKVNVTKNEIAPIIGMEQNYTSPMGDDSTSILGADLPQLQLNAGPAMNALTNAAMGAPGLSPNYASQLQDSAYYQNNPDKLAQNSLRQDENQAIAAMRTQKARENFAELTSNRKERTPQEITVGLAEQLKNKEAPTRPSKASLYAEGSGMPFQGAQTQQFRY